MSPLSRLYRHCAERRGSALIYAIGFAVLGAAMGAFLAFVLLVAPIAYVGGTVLQMPVVGSLIDVACDVYDVPVLGSVAEWTTGWFGGKDACDAIEKIRAVDTEAEASGFTGAMKVALDCANQPADKRDVMRKEGWCKDGLLADATQSVIPSDKAEYLIGIYIRAGDKYQVPWKVIAAVHGARTLFGEKNCAATGGQFRFTEKEIEAYGVDAGSVPADGDGQKDSGIVDDVVADVTELGTDCWKYTYTRGETRRDGSPWVQYTPDGNFDARDPVDAIFTMARLLSENGAKIPKGEPIEWDYKGKRALGCAVDEELDGEGIMAYIEPPKPDPNQADAEASDGAGSGETPGESAEAGEGEHPIMGPSRLTVEQIMKWWKSTGKKPRITVSMRELITYYLDEGAAQKVRGDVALAQAIEETGWLYFPSGGQVEPDDNNFAGIGAVNGGNEGNNFKTARDGVRGQIQHLWVYADKNAKKNKVARPLRDGRFELVTPGSAPSWEDLGGKWAQGAGSGEYGTRILELYNQMLRFNDIEPKSGPVTDGVAAPADAGANGASGGVVWVQAGHVKPYEPGFTHAGASGVAGTEAEFNARVRDAVIGKLTASGIDAKPLVAKVDPMNAEGDVFISIHHDQPRAPGGVGHVGHAMTGGKENTYQGMGTPRTPASKVNAQVQESSKKLATEIDKEFKKVYTTANGAKGPWGGIRTNNTRVTNYYGFYRTKAKARVILEVAASDELFLKKTDVIATATATAIENYLGVEGVQGATETESGKKDEELISGIPPKNGILPTSSYWAVSGVKRVHFPVKTRKRVALINNFEATAEDGTGGHPGVDIKTPARAKVQVVAPGTVAAIGKSRDQGYEIRIRATNGDVYVYGHLASVRVKKGQRVTAQQVLGIVRKELGRQKRPKGATGLTAGSYLHFGILPREQDVRYANVIKALATWLGKKLPDEPVKEKGQTIKADGMTPVDAGGGAGGASPSTGTEAEKQIREFFNSTPQGRKSPLKPFIPDMVRIAQREGLNPRIIPAIALQETGLATDPGAGEDIRSKYNAWGIGPHWDLGASWTDGIERFVFNLVHGDYYLRDGKYRIADFRGLYCKSACGAWDTNVIGSYTQMGGNANDPIFTEDVIEKYGNKGGGRSWGEAEGETGPIQYTGPRQTDPISKAVAHREGEKKPHSACYVAVVHDWYQGMMDRPQSISENDPSLEGTVLAQKAIEAAKTKIGLDYLWGGGHSRIPTGSDRVDCSGLMRYAFSVAGLGDTAQMLGGTTTWFLWGAGTGYEGDPNAPPIETKDWIRGRDMSKVQPGDMVFPHLGHVMMYIGDGKFIESPRTGLKVRIGKMSERSKWVGWVRSKKIDASGEGTLVEMPEDGWLVGMKEGPKITKTPIPYGEARQDQMKAYMTQVHGRRNASAKLTSPLVIVHHMSGAKALAPTLASYRDNKTASGETPGDCPHFVVDTDGTIIQTTPLTLRCRLSTGLDYTAVSVSHVGERDGALLSNKAQLKASYTLTRWLQRALDIKTDRVLGSGSSESHTLRVKAAGPVTDLSFGTRAMEKYTKGLRKVPLGGNPPPPPEKKDEPVTGGDTAGGADPQASPGRFTSAIRKLNKTEIARMKEVGSWKPGCPVDLDDLRSISVSYKDFSGATRQGTIVMHTVMAKETVRVFEKLYGLGFPIRKMEPIEAYYPPNGDGQRADWLSIEADNTSGFNCRKQSTGTGKWSQHAYGRAMDINPIENPWVDADGTVYHTKSKPYVTRTKKPGVLLAGSAAVKVLTSTGWEWGGAWSGDKDYQHFEYDGTPPPVPETGPQLEEDDGPPDAPDRAPDRTRPNPPPDRTPTEPKAKTVSLQGDSLSSASKPLFNPRGFQVVSYDAEGGREAPEAFRKLSGQKLGRIVVYAIGTNGATLWSKGEWRTHLRKVMARAGEDRCVVLPTVWVRGRAAKDFNAVLEEMQSEYGSGRVQIAEWAEAVRSGRVSLPDGTHAADEAGWKVRVAVVVDAIKRCAA